ncbi:nuclear transport factor 2 family protein [Streptosporangium sp. NPDC000396]|uniref:nuclear transport factor 2 family protein n=1 Tax=Streptosporangium sp. NPDC000396 TaxID=3366185 RepID=UPI003684D7AA
MTETSALTRAEATALAYRKAVESGDVEAVIALFAPDVVFHSPISTRVRFEGRDSVRPLFKVALASLSGLAFHTDIGDERRRTLVATARIGRQELEEATLLLLDEEARIAEVTMWIRPLPGVTALMLKLAPGMARLAGRPVLGVLAEAAIRPLAFFVRTGDRTLVPMLARSPGGAPSGRPR